MPADAVSASILEFLDWISQRPRTYPETMEAWRTHCPRLSVWEDVLAAGLVEVVRNSRPESAAVLTPDGRAALLDSAR